MSFFPAAYAILQGEEGGYANDPQDPGGETYRGISRRFNPAWRGWNLIDAHKAAGPLSNAVLDADEGLQEECRAFYQREYWLPAGCDAMSWERALCLFDCAVNQGLSFARTLYHLEAPDIMAARALRYTGSAEFTRFGKGWLTRLFTILRTAQRTPTS